MLQTSEQTEEQIKFDSAVVSIIVPTFRRPMILGETIAELIKLDYPQERFEIIVVDDGSDDETAETVKSFQSKFANLIYHYQKNSGVATARNTGAKIAKGDVLIFIDDDILPASNAIQKHLKNLEEFGKCLVNGHWEFAPKMKKYLENDPFGQFRLKTEIWVKEGTGKKILRDQLYEPTGITACCLGVRKTDFWDIGGFDEQFPFAGCEDQEFSLRAARAGYQFIYDYSLKLLHNDQRLSVEQFGERQRRGAITKVLLATKYPQEEGNHPMIVENGFVKKGEPLKLSVKKNIKRFFASSFLLNSVLMTTKFLEKNWQNNFLLSRSYNLICGIYIFRGIREGIAKYGSPSEIKTA